MYTVGVPHGSLVLAGTLGMSEPGLQHGALKSEGHLSGLVFPAMHAARTQKTAHTVDQNTAWRRP